MTHDRPAPSNGVPGSATIRPVDVAAYYFPGFHSDPLTTRWRGKDWTEWNLVATARPRFPGHAQPRVPTWGLFDEADPAWASRQSEFAKDHGVDILLFDWYWYGHDFLNGALDRGFLGMREMPVKFALMWANHDWLAIHPATSAHEPPVLREGAITSKQFDEMTEVVIDRYFSRADYYRIAGKPYFSLYEPETFVRGVGGLDAAKKAMDRFRHRVEAAGFDGLHLNIIITERTVLPGERVTQDTQMLIEQLSAASATSYVWIHHYDPAVDGFPLGQYGRARDVNEQVWETARLNLSVPYFPNVTMSWDSSPRALQTDAFDNRGYPYMGVLDATPAEFEQAVTAALKFARQETRFERGLVTVNAWNEWTEGSYLLPDERHGDAFARAVASAVKLNAL